jgi:hypothetical protein
VPRINREEPTVGRSSHDFTGQELASAKARPAPPHRTDPPKPLSEGSAPLKIRAIGPLGGWAYPPTSERLGPK